MAGLPGYEQKKTVGRPLPTQADVASPGYAASPWERNVQAADDRAKQASFNATNMPVASPGYAASPWERNVQAADDRAKQASQVQPTAYSGQVQRAPASTPTPEMRGLGLLPTGGPTSRPVQPDTTDYIGNLAAQKFPGQTTMSPSDLDALGLHTAARGQLSAGAPMLTPIEPVQLAPGTQAQSQMQRGPIKAIPMHKGRVGSRAPVATAPAATPTPAVDYDAVVQRVSDRQVPFQPANVFSDSTSGTGEQHLRPTGWIQDTVRDGHVSLPTAQSGNTPGAPAAAPTFGGLSATAYLADAKARDAQAGQDAETRRLAHAREIDMNSARYDMSRAQGINGNRLNAQLYKTGASQLAQLEAARVADAANATELAKTGALVQGDLDKTDMAGQYKLQEADITGNYGMMGDYATAQAAGSVAQANIDKARIAAQGTIQAAQIKAQPTAKEQAEAYGINARNGLVADALANGDMATAYSLSVGQQPMAGKVVGDGATGYLFLTPDGKPQRLSPTDLQNMIAQNLAQRPQ